MERAAHFAKSWPGLPATRQRALLTAMVKRTEVRTDRIDIHIRPTGLGALLDGAAALLPNVDAETQTLSVPVDCAAAGGRYGWSSGPIRLPQRNPMRD